MGGRWRSAYGLSDPRRVPFHCVSGLARKNEDRVTEFGRAFTYMERYAVNSWAIFYLQSAA